MLHAKFGGSDAHMMVAMEVDEFGETWGCPQCGRKVHVTWEVNNKPKIDEVEPGNTGAAHLIQKVLITIEPAQEKDPPLEESRGADLASDYVDRLFED